MENYFMPWLLCHFIGDFILQNDFMAQYKKKNSLVCLLHVGCYMIPFFASGIEWYLLIIIAIQHFIQDRTNLIKWYCKKGGSFQKELEMDSLPWGHFIVDQIFHIWFIWVLLEFNKDYSWLADIVYFLVK